MRIVIIILFLSFLLGCPFASDYFYLNKFDTEQETVIGIRLNEWNKVEQKDQNSFLLKSDAKVALAGEIIDRNEIYKDPDIVDNILGNSKKNIFQSSFIFDFGIKKLDNNPLHIYSRTSPSDFKIGELGINFRFFENNLKIYDGEVLLDEKTINFRKDETKRMILINNGDFIKVSLDCDDILYWKTERPISEYLIFESVGSGSWEINSVTLENNIPKGIFTNRDYIK